MNELSKKLKEEEKKVFRDFYNFDKEVSEKYCFARDLVSKLQKEADEQLKEEKVDFTTIYYALDMLITAYDYNLGFIIYGDKLKLKYGDYENQAELKSRMVNKILEFMSQKASAYGAIENFMKDYFKCFPCKKNIYVEYTEKMISIIMSH